jgi:hypothetical protein
MYIGSNSDKDGILLKVDFKFPTNWLNNWLIMVTSSLPVISSVADKSPDFIATSCK